MSASFAAEHPDAGTLPIRIHPPVFTCFRSQSSRNFNALILILFSPSDARGASPPPLMLSLTARGDPPRSAARKYAVIEPAAGKLDRRIFSDQAIYDDEMEKIFGRA